MIWFHFSSVFLRGERKKKEENFQQKENPQFTEKMKGKIIN